MRGLLHSGVTVNVDHPDPAARAHGVVAVDRSEALFAYVQLASSVAERHPPQWYAAGGCSLSGLALAQVGIELPVLSPEQAMLLRFRANG